MKYIEVDVCGKFGVTPLLAEAGSVGYDIALPAQEGPILMPYNSTRRIDTGILFKPPEKCWILVSLRSSSYKKGVRISNTIGVIDPSYQGPNDHLNIFLTREPKKMAFVCRIKAEEWEKIEVQTSLCTKHNFSVLSAQVLKDTEGYVQIYKQTRPDLNVFEAGERFCQAIFLPYYRADLVQKTLEEWEGQDRGGLGSTGK